MSHGFNKNYTRKLKTWKDPYWKYDRHGEPLRAAPRKPWWEMQYYIERPKAAATRRKWERKQKNG